MGRLSKIAFAITFLCIASFGQGFSFRDIPTVAAKGGGGSGGGGTSGGGGATSPGAPTEYWDMQEGAGNRIGEVSGTVMTGASVGNSASGLFGNCAQWASSSDLLSTVAAYSEGTSVAWNFWYKIPSPTGAGIFQAQFECGTGLNDTLDFEQWNGVDETDGVLAYTDGDVYEEITAGYGEPQTSDWRMVSLSYNGSTKVLDFYLDGELVGSTAGTATLRANATPRVRFNGQTGQETVRVDEVYFKYGTLTEGNVEWLWNSGIGRQFSDF